MFHIYQPVFVLLKVTRNIGWLFSIMLYFHLLPWGMWAHVGSFSPSFLTACDVPAASSILWSLSLLYLCTPGKGFPFLVFVKSSCNSFFSSHQPSSTKISQNGCLIIFVMLWKHKIILIRQRFDVLSSGILHVSFLAWPNIVSKEIWGNEDG